MKDKIKLLLKGYWILVVLVFIKFIIQYYAVNPVYELHRDEFLHLDQAKHIAFGFISVPPLTSLVSKLIFLLGGGFFWVRFLPAFFGAATIIVAWLLVEELNGKLLSKLLISCGLVFSVLVRMNILFQPNSFEILCWTALFYILIKYIRSENIKWLFYFAVIAALGFYNKYNIGFLLLGIFIGLIFTRHRKLFASKYFYFAVLLFIFLILPNIIWQVINGFPVVHHMAVLRKYQLDNNSTASFLINQLIIFIGSLPLILLAFFAFITHSDYKKYKLIALSFVIVLAAFSFLKAKDYYAMGLYPVIIAFGAVYAEKILIGWKMIIGYLFVLINIGVFGLAAKFIHPVLRPDDIIKNKVEFEKIGLLRWEDGKNHELPQDFSDMLGWKEMASAGFKAYEMIPEAEKDKTIIFCDNYGQAGALNYYNRSKTPEAYSFNTDYIFWIPKLDTIKNIILVGDLPDQKIVDIFDSIIKVGEVRNIHAREKGTCIFILKGAKPQFTKMFYQFAEERKKNWEIF